MNATPRSSSFQRHRFTVEEAVAIEATGAFGDVRFEVIDGELIDMAGDGPLHRRWTGALTSWLARALAPDAYVVLPNTTLRLSATNGPSPDFQVFSTEFDEAEVDGSKVLLVIEQSDTSLADDLGAKQVLYASFGVRDYWVIDLNARRVHVHSQPCESGYANVRVMEEGAAVEALLVPGLVLRLIDLPRVGGDRID